METGALTVLSVRAGPVTLRAGTPPVIDMPSLAPVSSGV